MKLIREQGLGTDPQRVREDRRPGFPGISGGKENIDVCVPTFQRPAWLKTLLDSLAKQQLEKISMRVIVVDNDAQRSGAGVVEAFRKKAPFPVIYDVEPTRGLSSVRNRLLSHVRSEYFAFLDDDETVEPDWLVTMLGALKAFQADAVFGAVRRILSAPTPAWARRNRAFLRTKQATGSLLTHGASSNVLVRSESLGFPPLRFDELFSLMGAEDTEFFHRLYLAGRKLVWCDEAVAYEYVPRARVRVAWVCLRAFRGGQGFTRIFVTRFSAPQKAVWFLTKCVKLGGAVLALPFAFAYSYAKGVNLLAKVCGLSGQFSALLGARFYFREYSPGRYRVQGAGLLPSENGMSLSELS